MNIFNKTLVHRLMENDISAGNEAVADEIIAANFYDHTNPPGMREGIAGHKAIVKLFHNSFTNLCWKIDDIFATDDDDKVVIRTTMYGTHTGEFFGIPPTNKNVNVSGIHVLRIANGKIAEHWGNNDDLGLMRQIGAMP